tara:strand:- start:1 stop:138 length:138 start_codon:yes stop_codon:yes gene_type:complete
MEEELLPSNFTYKIEKKNPNSIERNRDSETKSKIKKEKKKKVKVY